MDHWHVRWLCIHAENAKADTTDECGGRKQHDDRCHCAGPGG
jgi:hypothetical protein